MELQAAGELIAHTKKITYLGWHPVASDILLSASNFSSPCLPIINY